MKKKMRKILGDARKEKKFRAADLAKKLKVYRQQVTAWELGVILPPSRVFLKLCEQLELPQEKMIDLYLIEKRKIMFGDKRISR